MSCPGPTTSTSSIWEPISASLYQISPHRERQDPCSPSVNPQYGGERQMLSDNDAIATVAVTNLERARRFYEGTLGLSKVMENEQVLTFKTGRSTLFVYRSQYAGTNKATAVTFVAEQVEDLVRTLK